MYDTSFACTYHLAGDDEVAEDLYRVQLLQAFGNISDITQAESELDSLYADMANSHPVCSAIESLERCGSASALIQMGGGKECAFRLLFGFDTFHAMHRCVCDHKRNGAISTQAGENLVKACEPKQG
jgi:hypothetical protein